MCILLASGEVGYKLRKKCLALLANFVPVLLENAKDVKLFRVTIAELTTSVATMQQLLYWILKMRIVENFWICCVKQIWSVLQFRWAPLYLYTIQQK